MIRVLVGIVLGLFLPWVPTPSAEEMALVTPPSSVEPSTVSGNYRIGPEDLVDISVWKNPDLSLTVAVRPDGMISMPLLGDIQAGDRTPSELQRTIRIGLKEYMEDPTVSVIVREIRSQVFFILGEVTHPGRYPLNSETTLLQAVAIAGGFGEWAEKDRMIILRKNPERPSKTQQTISYKQIVSGKILDGNTLLKSGDTVIIP